MRFLKRALSMVGAWLVVSFTWACWMRASRLLRTLDFFRPTVICLAVGMGAALLVVVTGARRWPSVRFGCVPFSARFSLWVLPLVAVLAGLVVNAAADPLPIVAHRTWVFGWRVPSKGLGHCSVTSWRYDGSEAIYADVAGFPAVPEGRSVIGPPGRPIRPEDGPISPSGSYTPPLRACIPGQQVTVYTRAGRLGWERVVGWSL
jgi:hypothetical protein